MYVAINDRYENMPFIICGISACVELREVKVRA